MEKACVDTGILGIFFSKDCTSKVTTLVNQAVNGMVEMHVLKPVLCEAFYHVCKVEGKDLSSRRIATLIHEYPIIQVDLDESLIQLTGTLKCQHRESLSYIDCMSIAYCLNNRISFHTTEKTLKRILPETKRKLKIVAYDFKESLYLAT